MDPSVWSRGMYSSSSFCMHGFPAEHVSSFQLDTVRLKSEVSGLSVSFHKDSENIQMPPQSAHVTDNTAGHLPARNDSPPAASPCGHQAKRARVENIIKGMSGSPGARRADEVTSRHREPDGVRGNERTGPASQTICAQHQHPRRLRTRLDREGERRAWNRPPESSPPVADSRGGFHSSSGQTHRGWKKVKPTNHFRAKHARMKLMADVLKYELSRAVSRSVDSIFKSAPLLQTSPNHDEGGAETGASLRTPVGKDEAQEVPGVQTEALSLVVQKRPRGPEPQVPNGGGDDDSALRKVQTLGCTWPARCEGTGAKRETLDARWRPAKVRAKVTSRSPERRAASTGNALLESPKAQVKMESDGLRTNNLYVLNESLTTNHLRKAKHMFFYTRYPSSLVLKSCFFDVQFTRCITSQLIKWFSNFREFYYIQMEKFARHAVAAAADVRSLTVGRESELFRALNVHYNKTNDFQVPDRFLEVAEITLREFYVAILTGKDHDPSWKKPIYKVICKLDSDVAAQLKSHPSG